MTWLANASKEWGTKLLSLHPTSKPEMCAVGPEQTSLGDAGQLSWETKGGKVLVSAHTHVQPLRHPYQELRSRFAQCPQSHQTIGCVVALTREIA